jgi:dihydropyrimidinase
MTIIQNGRLVSPEGLTSADLALEQGKIVAIAPHIQPNEGDTVMDAAGCYVFPGFIDGHTHLEMDNGATMTADDFASGTRAAACGGTTTIVDFATQDKGNTLTAALDAWHSTWL